MKAMILCAGLGSRLSPLTSIVPKPLVPVGGKPILFHIIDRLKKAGVDEIIMNIQHLPNYFRDFLDAHENYNTKINFVFEDKLTGDAGGMKSAEFFFANEDFFVVSGDDLSDIDLEYLMRFHKSNNSLLSMPFVEVDNPSRYGIGEILNNKLISFKEKPQTEIAKPYFANTSIYAVNSRIFDYIPSRTFYGFGKDLIPKLIENKESVFAFYTNEYCKDIGTVDSYFEANFDIIDRNVFYDLPQDYFFDNNLLYHESLQNDGILINKNVIGKNVKIGRNSIVKNSVVWDNVCIGDNCIVSNCILGYNMMLASNTLIHDAICISS